MDELDYLSYGLNDALSAFIKQADIQEIMYFEVISNKSYGRYTYFHSDRECLYICEVADLVQEDFVFNESKISKHNVLYNILNDVYVNGTQWRLDEWLDVINVDYHLLEYCSLMKYWMM